MDDDRDLARLAVARGLVTSPMIEECIREQAGLAKDGIKENLTVIMVRKGFIKEEELQSLIEEPSVAWPQLPGFHFLHHVGRGSVAEVYVARLPKSERLVVVKVFPADLGKDPARVETFLASARGVSTLLHPNLMQIMAAGRHEGVCYLMLELVPGQSLAKLMGSPDITEKRALRIMVPTAAALCALESAKRLHLELRPSNILLRNDGVPKLCEPELGLGASSRGRWLKVESVPLSGAEYASPEQASGQEPLDVRSDIYSYGACLYAALTGVPPYSGPTPAVVLAKHQSDPVPDLLERRPNTAPALACIVARCMQKNPHKRYQTFVPLLEDLRRIYQPPTTRRVADVQAPRKKIAWPIVAACLCGLLAATSAVLLAFGTRTDPPVQQDGASDATSQRMPVVADPSEGLAQELWAKAEEALKREAWAEAEEHSNQLATRLRRTRFFQAHATEIQKALVVCAQHLGR